MSGKLETSILNREEERRRTVTFGTTTLLLSAETLYELADEDVPKSADGTVHVFAESVVVSGELRIANGTVSAHRLRVTAIEASGMDGATPVASPVGEPLDGDDGDDGGKIGIFLEDGGLAPLVLKARGGQGGSGQPGGPSKAGGAAGDGGAGGTIDVFVSHPALRWLESMRATHRSLGVAGVDGSFAIETSLRRLLVDVRHCRAESLADPGQGDVLDRLVTHIERALETKDLSRAALAGIFEDATLALQTVVEEARARSGATLDVRGGSPGAPGRGVTDGATGSEGKDGAAKLELFAKHPRPTVAIPFVWAHPAQCAMTLARAKMAFLFADPVRQEERIREAATLFERVRARTEPFASMSVEAAASYDALAAELCAPNAVASLRTAHATASTFLTYLSDGNDYFGNAHDYAPLTSVELLEEKGVRPLLDAFKTIEAAYNEHFEAIKAKKTTLDYVKKTRSKIHTVVKDSAEESKQLVALLAQTAALIDGYVRSLPGKLADLQSALEAYRTAVEKDYQLNVSKVLSALGQIAFAPESPLMYAVQFAEFAYDAVTEIEDIQGHKVRRGFVLQQIENVGSNLAALKDTVDEGDEGTVTLSDPGGKMLLANASAISTFLEAQYGKFKRDSNGKLVGEALELKRATDDYVEAVTRRNTLVLKYNIALQLLTRRASEVANIGEQEAALAVVATDASELAPEAYTPLLMHMFHMARDRVLLHMSLAARAYRFWSLNDTDILAEALPNVATPAITSVELESLQSEFWARYVKAVGDLGSPQSFRHRGRIWSVPALQLHQLRKQKDPSKRTLIVRIPTTRKDTTTGSFINLANVRVTEVRVWLRGAAADGPLTLSLTHTGAEEIVDRFNHVFSFSHQPITKTFEYDPRTGEVTVPATFQFDPNDRSTSPRFAKVGPFTEWHVTIEAAKNPGLRWETITGIDFELFGDADGFV